MPTAIIKARQVCSLQIRSYLTMLCMSTHMLSYITYINDIHNKVRHDWKNKQKHNKTQHPNNLWQKICWLSHKLIECEILNGWMEIVLETELELNMQVNVYYNSSSSARQGNDNSHSRAWYRSRQANLTMNNQTSYLFQITFYCFFFKKAISTGCLIRNTIIKWF